MVWDWILSVALRPGATFEYARQHLRFGYWWIVLTVMTMEMVMLIYAPIPGGSTTSAGTGDLIFVYGVWFLLLFDLQALLLLGAARLFRWQLSWADALKYMGLSWAVLFFEDAVGFYPMIKGMHMETLWLTIPFILWYFVVLTVGVRRVSGLSPVRALAVALLAAGPWRIGLFVVNWMEVTRALS